MTERTFDRIPSPPHIGLAIFNIAPVVAGLAPRSYTWGCTTVLDQKRAGYCVGFGWEEEAASKPVVVPNVTNASGIRHFKLARTKYDARPLDSDDTDDGTYVLAGAKAAQELGQLGEYRWATNLEDGLVALGHNGPIVMGTVWKSGMMETDSDGYIHATGIDEGGHCYILRGRQVKKGRSLLQQTWGPQWGGTEYGPGTAWIADDDLGIVYEDDGECCVPMRRLKPAA